LKRKLERKAVLKSLAQSCFKRLCSENELATGPERYSLEAPMNLYKKLGGVVKMTTLILFFSI
jgi:hypothetical protein